MQLFLICLQIRAVFDVVNDALMLLKLHLEGGSIRVPNSNRAIITRSGESIAALIFDAASYEALVALNLFLELEMP